MILNQYLHLSYLLTTKQLVFTVYTYTRAAVYCEDDDENNKCLSEIAVEPNVRFLLNLSSTLGNG